MPLAPATIALAVGPPLRVATVAALAYLRDHSAPAEPADLSAHRCIAYGEPSGERSVWSFERDGRATTVVPGRGPVSNDGDLLVAAAIEGASSTSQRSWSPHRSRAAASSACWRNGARRSPATT